MAGKSKKSAAASLEASLFDMFSNENLAAQEHDGMDVLGFVFE